MHSCDNTVAPGVTVHVQTVLQQQHTLAVVFATPSCPSRCKGPGGHPRKVCENSDAKSCILVTTHTVCLLLQNLLLFENYGRDVVGTNTLLVPQPKSWDTSPPVPTVVAPMSRFKHQNVEHNRSFGLPATLTHGHNFFLNSELFIICCVER